MTGWEVLIGFRLNGNDFHTLSYQGPFVLSQELFLKAPVPCEDRASGYLAVVAEQVVGSRATRPLTTSKIKPLRKSSGAIAKNIQLAADRSC